MKKLLKWGGIALVVLFVIGTVAGGGKDSTSSSGSSSGGSTTQNQEAAKVYKIGEEVQVDEVKWKVTEAKDRGTVLKARDSRFAAIAKDKTSAAGKYIQVSFEVENLGKEMKSASNLKLIDSQGREFIHATDVTEWLPEGKEMFLIANLNPNVKQAFTEIYEVPADATGLKLKVGDLKVFGSKEAEIELGL